MDSILEEWRYKGLDEVILLQLCFVTNLLHKQILQASTFEFVGLLESLNCSRPFRFKCSPLHVDNNPGGLRLSQVMWFPLPLSSPLVVGVGLADTPLRAPAPHGMKGSSQSAYSYITKSSVICEIFKRKQFPGYRHSFCNMHYGIIQHNTLLRYFN